MQTPIEYLLCIVHVLFRRFFFIFGQFHLRFIYFLLFHLFFFSFLRNLHLAAQPTAESTMVPLSWHSSWHSQATTGAMRSGRSSSKKSETREEKNRYQNCLIIIRLHYGRFVAPGRPGYSSRLIQGPSQQLDNVGTTKLLLTVFIVKKRWGFFHFLLNEQIEVAVLKSEIVCNEK